MRVDDGRSHVVRPPVAFFGYGTRVGIAASTVVVGLRQFLTSLGLTRVAVRHPTGDQFTTGFSVVPRVGQVTLGTDRMLEKGRCRLVALEYECRWSNRPLGGGPDHVFENGTVSVEERCGSFGRYPQSGVANSSHGNHHCCTRQCVQPTIPTPPRRSVGQR